MPKAYNQALIQCPFYLSEGTKSLSCEGITDDCRIYLLFNSKEKRDRHRKIFCEEHYKCCELYGILERKYDDD